MRKVKLLIRRVTAKPTLVTQRPFKCVSGLLGGPLFIRLFPQPPSMFCSAIFILQSPTKNSIIGEFLHFGGCRIPRRGNISASTPDRKPPLVLIILLAKLR